MTVSGADYSFGRPSVAELKAAGIAFVCRYLSHDAAKNLSPAEARELSAGGIHIVANWEAEANAALGGAAAGERDAQAAGPMARACGMPPGRPIYFSVDFDPTPAQLPAVLAYLRAAEQGLAGEGYAAGVYGGLPTVKAALDGAVVRWAWQSYAWSEGQWDPRAQLQQYHNNQMVAGVAVDLDRAADGVDYGGWMIAG